MIRDLRPFALTLALLVAIVQGTLAFVAAPVAAQDYRLKSLRIDHAFARATPPGARSGGVFLTVENTGSVADRLIRVSSPVARTVELHDMTLDGGVMRMRAVSTVEIKPGDKLELKPGGYHAMLSGLKQPLKPGDRFLLTLTFQHAGAIELSVTVEAMSATPTHADSSRSS
jgi:copper(I)-binding protein